MNTCLCFRAEAPRLPGPSSRRTDYPMRRQHGQALTEFLMVALVLVPLFVLIPFIAKYQDIGHMTQMAGRYTAFDATIRNDSTAGSWKPPAQLADEVRRRFFSNIDAPIKTNDVAGNFDANRNPFWRAPNHKPLLAEFANVAVTFGPDRRDTHADAFETASDMALFPLASGLGFGSHGIYTSNVTIKLANLPAGLSFYVPFDNINIAMTRSTSILTDSWTARNAADVETRIQNDPAVFPAGSLAKLSGIADLAVTLIDGPGGVRGPKLGSLDFWRDVVPKDRLKSAK